MDYSKIQQTIFKPDHIFAYAVSSIIIRTGLKRISRFMSTRGLVPIYAWPLI